MIVEVLFKGWKRNVHIDMYPTYFVMEGGRFKHEG